VAARRMHEGSPHPLVLILRYLTISSSIAADVFFVRTVMCVDVNDALTSPDE
jgi:hypothetical protein